MFVWHLFTICQQSFWPLLQVLWRLPSTTLLATFDSLLLFGDSTSRSPFLGPVMYMVFCSDRKSSYSIVVFRFRLLIFRQPLVEDNSDDNSCRNEEPIWRQVVITGGDCRKCAIFQWPPRSSQHVCHFVLLSCLFPDLVRKHDEIGN